MQLYWLGFGQTTLKQSPTSRVLHHWPSTFILGKRPSPEPGQIRGLFLWYGTEIVKNIATTIYDSWRLPHQGVRQAKDTLCNIRCRFHIEDYVNHIAKACNIHTSGLYNIRCSISHDVFDTCDIFSLTRTIYKRKLLYFR